MPLFEFHCSSCRQEFELLVRNGEAVACSHCGAHTVEKLLSASVPRSGSVRLPIAPSSCPPSDAPPCRPGCCRL